MEWIDDEAVALDSSSGRLHYLNAPAALAYALMLELGYEAAMKELRERFTGKGLDPDDLERVTEEFLERGLLESG